MQALILEQAIYLLKIAIAAICGTMIGFERENHLKLAGIRTHSIVALTSAMITIISKYGFEDVLGQYVSLDPSRIAAGIVTAIGFLGAGVIFTRKMSVSGLTTAAGLWATVGIGMAIGSGLYAVGIASTVLILILQFIFHRSSHIVKSPTVIKLVLDVKETDNILKIIHQSFSSCRIKIININILRQNDGTFEIKLYITFPDHFEIERMLTLMNEIPEMNSIDVSAD